MRLRKFRQKKLLGGAGGDACQAHLGKWQRFDEQLKLNNLYVATTAAVDDPVDRAADLASARILVCSTLSSILQRLGRMKIQQTGGAPERTLGLEAAAWFRTEMPLVMNIIHG